MTDPDVPSLADLDPESFVPASAVLTSRTTRSGGGGGSSPAMGGLRSSSPRLPSSAVESAGGRPGGGLSPGPGVAPGLMGAPPPGGSPYVNPQQLNQMQGMMQGMSPEQMQQMFKSVQALTNSGAIAPHVLRKMGLPPPGGASGPAQRPQFMPSRPPLPQVGKAPLHTHGISAAPATGPEQSAGSGIGSSASSSSSGMPVQAQAPPPDNPLIAAARRGDVAMVQYLLNEGCDIQQRDHEGNSPLHWTVFTRDSPAHLQVARLLLDRGADPNATNTIEDACPLHWAAIAGNAQALILLLEKGADAEQSDRRGYNALHHATQYNECLLAYYLIKRGVPVDTKDKEGHTALHWAAYLGHINTVRMLLNQGAYINAQDSQGYSPLHWAAVKGNTAVAISLLKEGADSRLVDNENHKAAFVAAKKGYFRLANQIGEYAAYYQVANAPNGKRNQKLLWFIVGWLGFYIATFFLMRYPLWLALLLVYAEYTVGKLFFQHRWPGEHDVNTLWQGMFVGGYWLCTSTYFTQMHEWHVANTSWPVMFIFYLCNVIASSLYLYLAWADPGTIKRTPHNDVEWLLQKMEKGERVPEMCASCMIAKPLRSKHCKTCDVCVAKFDHHCFWLSRDVGLHTHRLFVVLMLLVFLGHCWWAVMAYSYMTWYPGSPDSLFPNVFINALIFYENTPLVFFLTVSHLCQIGWETMALYQVFNVITTNITFNEMTNGDRYKYLQGPTGGFYNPFRKATMKDNFLDWLKPKIDYFSIYFVTREALQAV